MVAYYNDNDKKVCAWLRELIKAGLIADGDVDERSILDVKPSDLAGFAQCHFFAGIGGWSYALRLAGWPDDEPVWTGSCPCQPFSVAGKGRGDKDERHLWPEFYRLIAECSPPVVFGEQVASKAGRGWLAGVRADLEAVGYGVGAADLCAAGIGAPHIRQRLYWVAQSDRSGARDHSGPPGDEGRGTVAAGSEGLRQGDGKAVPSGIEPRGADGGLADSDGSAGHAREPRPIIGPRSSGLDGGVGNASLQCQHGGPCEVEGAVCEERGEPRVASGDCGLADAERDGFTRSGERDGGEIETGNVPRRRDSSGCKQICGPWSGAVLIPCADGKARRIEPSIEPLVDGLPGRVGLLRGYGNAIVPQTAQAFIESYLDIVSERRSANRGA
ncbi:MAG: DNA cytosine methyltransferase [Candidatus Paceibacterota bacterium]